MFALFLSSVESTANAFKHGWMWTSAHANCSLALNLHICLVCNLFFLGGGQKFLISNRKCERVFYEKILYATKEKEQLNSTQLFLHFFNPSELNWTLNCERTVHTCDPLHCGLCLVQKSFHRLLPCWVAILVLTLFAPGPPHSVEQSRDSAQQR